MFVELQKVHNCLISQLFFFFNTDSDTPTLTIELEDNELIYMPEGAQHDYEHAVEGQYSENIRWVATIRISIKNTDEIVARKGIQYPIT